MTGTPQVIALDPPSAEPAELAEYGYREDEFVVSGEARVYAPVRIGDERELRSMARHDLDFGRVATTAEYSTRVLLRRPADPTRCSGVTYLEPLHAVGERGTLWDRAADWITRTGAAWVGVTASCASTAGEHPVGGVAWLRATDPARYGQLHLEWSNPALWPVLPSDGGTTPPGGGMAGELASADWTGQTYSPAFSLAKQEMLRSYAHSPDVMCQVGELLRLDAAPLGAITSRLYVAGTSLTGKYWYMFLQGGRHPVHGGRPVFDGYVVLVYAPPPGLAHPAGATLVSILSEREVIAMSCQAEPAPSDTDTPRRRHYEIAGAGHRFTGSGSIAPTGDSPLDPPATGGPQPGWPEHVEHNTRPNAAPLHAILDQLDRWVGDGTPMPSADRIERDAGAPDGIHRDTNGNAVGGLRGPWIAVPDAQFLPWCPMHPNDGAVRPFPAEVRVRRGLTASTYLAAVERHLDDMIERGWLLAEDRAEYRRAAADIAGRW
jgi:hypothetical protein